MKNDCFTMTETYIHKLIYTLLYQSFLCFAII